jgi:ligand-binding SRPBCC domain-containing protein
MALGRKIQTLRRVQRMPIAIEKAWEFFSNPANLPEITPPSMKFRPTSPLPSKMYPGLLITYTVSPFLSIPIKWVTEITHIDESKMFTDEQRFGPYRFWHHRHLFNAITGGVEMEDIVTYILPFDPFSRPVNRIIVRRTLEGVFNFRYEVIKRKFGSLD